ncbi:MAG: bifunctional phosphoribosylaminoimidazolecarboxamide formyltransferase/IMP cyclohydrolase [Deltaproteobacteria bacterium]|nr:bifunctional phosphoribosylaminoimidazolecarboxamide formyltransferase/IMP cyclohydrolase [Deltaproteobacteria bacterium]
MSTIGELLHPVRTALLSVSDKRGLVELARTLAQHGVRLVASGGTRAELQAAGLAVDDVASYSGHGQAFGGRIKTLSFEVMASILFDRREHAAEANALGLQAIDLVVVNLYPFAQRAAAGVDGAELVESIDIGGPTLIRAAAKNFAGVAVLTDPSQYAELQAELAANACATRLDARKRWMQQAFVHTAAYDTAIAEHYAGQPLRYGENPHQTAVFVPDGPLAMQVHGGKALSYNNLLDIDAALSLVLDLPEPALAIVKHGNPCGAAMGGDLARLLELAWAGDPVSAFGGVLACNRPLDREDLQFLAMDTAERRFVEVVAAPAFSDEAVAYLSQNKNLRIVTCSGSLPQRRRRSLAMGTVSQSRDDQLLAGLKFVSRMQPWEFPVPLLEFGLAVVRAQKSNAIAIVRSLGQTHQLVGMGAGQPNRVASVRLAVEQAHANLRRENPHFHPMSDMAQCILVSDAFFPFADGPELALQGGLRVIVEPGGSVRDAEVIAACDRANAVLVFTGTRHFLH